MIILKVCEMTTQEERAIQASRLFFSKYWKGFLDFDKMGLAREVADYLGWYDELGNPAHKIYDLINWIESEY